MAANPYIPKAMAWAEQAERIIRTEDATRADLDTAQVAATLANAYATLGVAFKIGGSTVADNPRKHERGFND